VAAADTPEKEPSPSRPAVEVVFVLDTTGSMGGLIEGAKQKIWSIANEIAKGKPSPIIRMGLVAYRDRGDAYVTRVFDLTTNLDRMYSNLLSLTAAGGGDEPEHVLMALNDSVDRISWSSAPQTFKVIYLVGDAPPHHEYGDTPSLEAILQKAMRKGLVLNAIQCGGLASTTVEWRKISRLGEGKFFAIAQDGGVQVAATPFDGRLAELSGRLDATALAYGGHERRKRARAEMSFSLGMAATAAAASAPAAADRAAFRAKEGFDADTDLLTGLAANKVGLAKLKDGELPDELRGLSPQMRQAKLARLQADRRRLQEQLQALSAQREKFLAQAAKKKGRRDSFDILLSQSLKAQAARQGIAY